jgi:glycosyltransferase involved in cell wall biosynthesis
MKVVLLVLSGNRDQARARLRQSYPGAIIENVSRDELESQSATGRIRVLRSLRPDVFAMVTERLAWQRGQNILFLFGALGGARRVLLIDSAGLAREETSAMILARLPIRLAVESAASARAIAKSQSHLKHLEQATRRSLASEKPSRWPNPDALRIAYLRGTPSTGSQAGGAATHISGFVRGATSLGARVQLISNDRIAGLDERDLILIDPEPLGTTRTAFDLRNNQIFSEGAMRELERTPFDLIYQRYGRFTWAGVEAGLRTGLPLFLEYNGSEVWIGKHWDRSGMLSLLKRFERLNLEFATRIFVVSEVEERNLLQAGIDGQKIIVNPNGVDTDEFRPGIGGDAVRRELGLADDEMLAGFVGTFGPWHGVLTLAEAITLMPEDCRVRFLLIGSGRSRDEVERTIKAAGKAHQVVFTGHVGHERVPALLDACDILLSPHVPLEDGSEFFGSPTKLFEYMAMGKAIVASRLGQIGEVLADQETALLVEPGNARELADAVLRLGGSRDLRDRLGAAARAQAIAKYTWKHNAQLVIKAYQDWLATTNM